MYQRVKVACSARRYARIRAWYTAQEAARRWGIQRRAAMDRAQSRRVRMEKGEGRTGPWRLAVCCVEAEAQAIVCDCRAVLRAVEEARKCP